MDISLQTTNHWVSLIYHSNVLFAIQKLFGDLDVVDSLIRKRSIVLKDFGNLLAQKSFFGLKEQFEQELKRLDCFIEIADCLRLWMKQSVDFTEVAMEAFDRLCSLLENESQDVSIGSLTKSHSQTC
ncbi:hypothetical protein L596_025413 [Steinernema carpocapsae]|uniref:Uncharacterized protein n=1 Tax=Steinernema carpocapsae TaxID=34508 RepID=A0A4U5M8J4_STECR|nr:hypothetical protein L596_025413 [Steinernema carpocapsae]